MRAVSDAPAGWYADPAFPGGSGLRYWDGLRWTEHVHQPAYPPAPQAYGPTTPDGQPLAGWWLRVGATLIDNFFLGIANLILTLPHEISVERSQLSVQQEYRRRLEAGDSGAFSWYLHQTFHAYAHGAWWSILPIVLTGAVIVCLVRLRGGSPGQLILGLRVRLRDRTGNLSWTRAILRQLAAQTAVALLVVAMETTGSILAWLLGSALAFVWFVLDVLWATWDPRRQTLHDKAVGTNVVRTAR